MNRIITCFVVLVGLSGIVFAEPQWDKLPTTPTLPATKNSGYATINGVKIWYAASVII